MSKHLKVPKGWDKDTFLREGPKWNGWYKRDWNQDSSICLVVHPEKGWAYLTGLINPPETKLLPTGEESFEAAISWARKTLLFDGDKEVTPKPEQKIWVIWWHREDYELYGIKRAHSSEASALSWLRANVLDKGGTVLSKRYYKLGPSQYWVEVLPLDSWSKRVSDV